MQSKVRSNSTKRVANLTADFANALHYSKDFNGVVRSTNIIVHRLGFRKQATVHRMRTWLSDIINLPMKACVHFGEYCTTLSTRKFTAFYLIKKCDNSPCFVPTHPHTVSSHPTNGSFAFSNNSYLQTKAPTFK